MRKFLKEILSDPLTGKDLIEENQAGKDFLSSENKMYPILENVPVLLPGPQKSHTNSDLHSQFHSDFNYADHYNEDANHFNYFEEEQSRATKEEIRRLHQAIIKRVPKNAELILDVGCGNGWVARYFLGKSKKGRNELVIEASSRTALRQGDWVLIPPYEGPAVNKQVNIELGNAKEYQLYNLKTDIGQQTNLAGSQPEKLKQLIAAYNQTQKDTPKLEQKTIKLE